MSRAEDGGDDDRITRGDQTPEADIDDERRKKFEKLANTDMESAEIAEAVLNVTN